MADATTYYETLPPSNALTLSVPAMYVLEEALTDYAIKLQLNSMGNPNPPAEEYGTALDLAVAVKMMKKQFETQKLEVF